MEFVSNGMIIGVDEVGKGSWAGPMLVVGFAAPMGWMLKGLRDSKQYEDHVARKKIYKHLQDSSHCFWNTRYVEAQDIDEVGMKFAHAKAIREAIEVCMNMLQQPCPGLPERIVVDGDFPPPFPGVECIPKADDMFPQVSAASVIAKVIHDELMISHAAKYPGYDFENNMGYGTKKHEKGIATLGLCPLHRRSFAPIRKYLSEVQGELSSSCESARTGKEGSGDGRAAKSSGGHGRGASSRGGSSRSRSFF